MSVPTRAELPPEKKWNVEAFYPSPTAWLEELRSVKGEESSPRWPLLRKYQGQLANPAMLKELAEHYFALDRKLSKLAVYAHLRQDEDLGNDEFKRNMGLIASIAQDFQHETAWIEPELLKLSDQEAVKLLQEPSLQLYRFYFERILTMRPHTLPAEQEELMALSGKALSSSHKAFSALADADMKFDPAVDSNGVEYPLSNGSYTSFMHSKDRNLRKTAMLNLYRKYGDYANTFCELLQGNLQGHVFRAKGRKFSSCLDAALFTNQIDPKVVRQLIVSVKKGKKAMVEYLELRKELLGVDELHWYDLFCPLTADIDLKMNYREAVDMVVASVAPLGKEYQNVLKKGLTEDRWVDPFQNTRKRSGAYSSGCYDSMPYILMNFHDTLYETMTLAHEAGHSMHSYLSRKNQPYVYSDYPIFVAEVASTFNEQLLFDELLKKVKTNQEKAYLINDQIDRLRSTLFRQTMFAELELEIHEMAERGEPLTPQALNQIYRKLAEEYYGPGLVIDQELEADWARMPHLYYNFYVYQYATGISAALALHEQVAKSPQARDRYLKFLSSGSSKYPVDLLKEAGVDMTSSGPVDSAVRKFAELVHELRKLLEH